MRKKTNLKFLGMVLCIILVTILFAFQSCKRDRSSADQPVSLGISTEDSSPSWSPDGTKIAFNSDKDEQNSDIYIMNVDGSNPTRLTDNPADDGDPSWSPDGDRVVFHSNRDGNWEVYTMNADGSDQARLTNEPANDLGPSWSPDGTRILFGSNRDGNWEIYTMNVDGSNQTRLTENTTDVGAPSWSPDGTKIAFTSDRDGNPEVYVMNEDGSDQIRLTFNSDRDQRPSWSPDGQKIAFASNRDGNWEIYTMNADGSDQTRLTNEPARDRWACWSPDGRRIVFESDRNFDMEVYVMEADGSNPVNLTNNAPVNEAFGLVPLPRSALDLDEIPYRIVFESYRETEGKENWEICLIDADGSNLINLTNTPEIDEVYPHASPDGRRVCFEAIEGEEKESRSRNVYTMNIDGTDRVKIAENAFQPCWSPDGKYIAYAPGEYPRFDPRPWANKGLEIYDLETSEARRHPNEKIDQNFCICWSPDGKWFVAARRGLIRAFKADDETMMVLSTPGCRPDISPNGKRIAWNGDDWNINIGTLDFDSPQSSVTDHRMVVACERDFWVFHVDWPPDGNYLTFSYAPGDGRPLQRFPAPGSNICICDLRTGKWTQVTIDGKHNKSPDWVPVQAQ